MIDWREAVCQSSDLNVTVCNINNLIDYARIRRRIKDYDLIIILHSAAGDDLSILLKTSRWFANRRGKLVAFIGNEYDLMSQKIDLLLQLRADYICSQLPLKAAQWIYSECQNTKILEMPHALNPTVYQVDPGAFRAKDVGFRGAIYPYFIGDIERNKLVEFFCLNANALNLNCDIENYKMHRTEWARFLNTCKGIIGAEAGTYFLDHKGQAVTSAKRYLRKHPKTSFEELYHRYFEPLTDYMSGKAISSRHFEPIGTKTCQLLLEGEYNGILKADQHYICIKNDLSNIDDVVRRFKDADYRRKIVEDTYQYVMDSHTYHHRVAKLIKAVL